MKQEQWLDWAIELQSLAQAGLTYGRDVYDLERDQRLRDIAAEMLAQNPGLGKFVWDEFQSGGSASLARIMVAVITIGLIGCALDRGMLALQQWLSWDKRQVLR